MTRIPTIFSTGAGAPDLPCVASAEEGADAWAAEGVGEGDGAAVCPLPAQGMSSAAAHRLAPRMRLKPLDPRSSGVEFLAGCTSRWVSERAGSPSSSRKPLRGVRLWTLDSRPWTSDSLSSLPDGLGLP